MRNGAAMLIIETQPPTTLVHKIPPIVLAPGIPSLQRRSVAKSARTRKRKGINRDVMT
jgi:hypothetical protein